MDAACPTNIKELLTFLPDQPKLHLEVKSSTWTADYTAKDPPPPKYRFISSRIYPDLLLNLKEFISGVVNDLNIGEVSCQSMQHALNNMSEVCFQNETHVSEYDGYVAEAVHPVVEAIAAAAGLAGGICVKREPVTISQWSQIGDFNFIVGRRNKTEDGRFEIVPLKACSDEDKGYWVLLSKTEALSMPFSLDATQKQTGAKAMVAKLALRMAVADAEFGLFFGGYIAIAAQLIKSTDPSRPGLILLLSPAFRLSNEALPIPETLTPFQADIQPEPFLAILVAMLCANLIPGHEVKSPPASFYQPLQLIPDEGDERDSGDSGEDRDGIPACSVQVGTNAMILQHPWLNCSDIHRISIIGNPSQRLFRCSDHPSSEELRSLDETTLTVLPLQPRNLLGAPHIPSTHVDTVILLEQIRASRWSSIYSCRVEGADKKCIMKLVSECHSEMVLRELYMYEVVLKGCSLVPQFYGTFQRPAGGWFGFLLENVGESLEDVYGSEWDDVKMDLGVVEWKNLVDSVKKLHSLGVMHGDLEPRNVARTGEGTFKFFDFGRSEVHRCRKGGCEEVRELLDV
ncbi:uncharacterized protein EV420DRAFT_773976 [Desarmillaria tabescens]|uniref:Protein kinase domain-containing protein n=1 Tax=Armillaria tabescens TaxID=1929756 RepID=A0AA39JVG4_ARMTA|nr:uncharacterized protein EV420DRAFT_773976 [Desarmillaria tabescens]KAK0449543.1 hypothetical protein EV420DRAFT_773976 [Desarmillaria tabescens]